MVYQILIRKNKIKARMSFILKKNNFFVFNNFFFKFLCKPCVSKNFLSDNHVLVYSREFWSLVFFVSNIFLDCREVLMCSNFSSTLSLDYRFIDKFKNIILFNKTRAHAFNFYQKIKIMVKHSFTKINQFVDLTAVDMLGTKNINNRFNVFYIFFSTFTKTRFFFSFVCASSNLLYSLSDFFPSTNWAERECFDMFGLKFKNHTDLRRILTDYGFRGFPLRKDFPVTGFLQVKFDEVVLNVVYEKLNLMQLEREISFINPWSNATEKSMYKDLIVKNKRDTFWQSDSYLFGKFI